MDGEEDLRGLPFAERRRRLEAFIARLKSSRIDLSPLQPFDSWEELAGLRAQPPGGDPQIAEGLMLKRWDSIYEAGRPKGPWFKWKRDPHLIDAVLMYAQRGHGKRSSFYSDYTFGVWREDANGDRALAPVGKAYFGFTDEELKQIDKFVRDNTIERFGPVRSVRADKDFGLVLEVAFEGLQRSTRHKSGVAMRFRGSTASAGTNRRAKRMNCRRWRGMLGLIGRKPSYRKNAMDSDPARFMAPSHHSSQQASRTRSNPRVTLALAAHMCPRYLLA